jgi:hypothetical protein
MMISLFLLLEKLEKFRLRKTNDFCDMFNQSVTRQHRGIDYMRKVMDGSSVADFGLLNRELSADLFLSGVVSTAQPEKIK